MVVFCFATVHKTQYANDHPYRRRRKRTLSAATLLLEGSDSLPRRQSLSCRMRDARLGAGNLVDPHGQRLREEAEKTGKIPSPRGKPKPLLKWDLAELLTVAQKAGWLPSALDLKDDWNWRKAKVGDYAEVVRMMRNLAHPARYLKDHHGRRVTNKISTAAVCSRACMPRLARGRNNSELLKQLEEEEKNIHQG
jgi:hypothetical protein